MRWLLALVLFAAVSVTNGQGLEPDGPAHYEHLDAAGQPVEGYDRWCWDDAGHTTMGETYALYVTYPGWPGWSCSQQTPAECFGGTCCADLYTLPTPPGDIAYVHIVSRDLCAATEEPNDHPFVLMYQQCSFTVPPGWCS